MGGSVFTTYVAATRVTGREKLLIMRPFPASPFQKGNGIGRELLLRVWRGDGVDWEALRAKYLEERSCSECAENKGKTAFTVGQWRRGDADRVCRECTARHRDTGEPYQCNVCRFWFSERHSRRSIAETKAQATVFAARAKCGNRASL